MQTKSATFKSSITKIKVILAQISDDAIQIDQANIKLKAHKTFADKALFAETLFSTYSDKFSHYVNETLRKTNELARLLNHSTQTNNTQLIPLQNSSQAHNELAAALLEQIEQQIASLTTALNANKTLHNDGQYRLDKRRQFFQAKNQAQKVAQRAKRAVQAITQSSRNHYQKLAEHHEFERRLATMIAEREFERAKCKLKRSQQLTLEILKLHQRLGRCRRAISQIERDIERSEKRS
ncbi:MAG: primosomal replication protein [Alteromonadaceae bacterium]|nr:primosomal replication protein [Alteromonadaceae bacterium]